MSNFLGLILVSWLIVYIMDWDIRIILIWFGIYLLLQFISVLINKMGFVTIERHLKALQALEKEKELVQKLRNRETAAEKEIRRLISEYGENYELSIKIIGQNAVFNAFLNDQARFMKYLNIYISNKKETTSKSEPFFDWRKILSVETSSSYEEVKSAYYILVKKHHPDTGGNIDKVIEVNRAWDEAKKHFKNEYV